MARNDHLPAMDKNYLRLAAGFPSAKKTIRIPTRAVPRRSTQERSGAEVLATPKASIGKHLACFIVFREIGRKVAKWAIQDSNCRGFGRGFRGDIFRPTRVPTRRVRGTRLKKNAK